MAGKSSSPSRSSSPNPRFTSQAQNAEDLLKEQTVGLVHLSDFRKRRAEALGQSDRGSQDATPVASGAATPDGREQEKIPAFKKRMRAVKKGGLSFGEEEEEEDGGMSAIPTPAAPSPIMTPMRESSAPRTGSEESSEVPGATLKKRLKPNASVALQPKAMTKSALMREAQLKESLRKEYLQIQEAVKQTEFVLPFVFFAGRDIPGGKCRIKKGDFIWLFLERARKLGVDMASKASDKRMRDWARIGVDDLMVVRGDLIIPHHFDFHYFILNHTVGYNNHPLFPYSSDPTLGTPAYLLPSNMASNPSTPQPSEEPSNYLFTVADRKSEVARVISDSDLEGYADEPALTKVVDRRWYERHKHIYPASLWEEFDPTRDYSTGARKDVQGNVFFFSR